MRKPRLRLGKIIHGPLKESVRNTPELMFVTATILHPQRFVATTFQSSFSQAFSMQQILYPIITFSKDF